MTFVNAIRTALLLSILAALAATSVATASSPNPVASASSKRIATVCAQRAKRASRKAASASRVAANQRRATTRRRCILRLRRTVPKQRGDVTPPSVAWRAPSAGATVDGKLDGADCEAAATDAGGIARVDFRVDGTPLNTELVAPYNCVVDTTALLDGTHTLTATAYDAAGNASSASATITVSNSAPAPSPPPAPEAEPTPTPSGDVTPPAVAWQTPTAGAIVSGALEGSGCVAAASDDRGVDRVTFSVDGTALNVEKVAPYNCAVSTTVLADGAHTLTAVAYDAAGNSRAASIGVNVLNSVPTSPPPTPSGTLVVGIDGGYAGWSSTETTYRAQLGAAVTRHEWNPTQPVNAQDALVLKAAAQVGTRIHALLGGNQLGPAAHYRDWTIAFIRRYGLGGSFWDAHPELDEARYAIRTFELGNEPYFGAMSASLYADTVRPTLEEVKRLGLPAKIILPSRVYGTDTSWMDTLYARIPDLNSLFYAFADHPYWYGHDPAQISPAGPFGRIDVLRRRMNEKGASAKPIFITEYGESTASCGSECVSEAVQAEHLSKMLSAAIGRTAWKVEMISVFQLLDRGTNSTDRELQFGLLRQNGAQKPSYAIVRSAILEHRG